MDNKKDKIPEHANNIWLIIVLQFMNIIFSLNSVLIKFASNQWKVNGLFYWKTLLALAVAFATLGIYAIIWQRILHKVSLSVAYMSKGLVVFWGLLWAIIFFDEHITASNVIGTIIIFCGTILVNKHE